MGRRPTSAAVGALVLLAVASGLGLVQLYWGTFVDESDNIATAALMVRGQALYRDVFAHHFPFPYLWLATVVRAGGDSIGALRGSLLLFEAVALALAMAGSPLWLPLGLTAVVWQTVAVLYYGNLVTYHPFKAFALLGVFALTVTRLGQPTPARPVHGAIIGVLGAVAILCDGMMLYPVAVALGALATARATRLALLTAIVTGGAITAACALWLLATGAWRGFVNDVVVFNTTVYARYMAFTPLPVASIARTALGFLDLVDARWWVWDPWLPLGIRTPDRWAFTGALYRLALVVTSAVFALRGRWRQALFVWLFGAALIAARGDERFVAAPLVLTGTFCAQWMATLAAEAPGARMGARPGIVGRAGVIVTTVARVVLGGMLVWLAVRGGANLWAHRRGLSFEATFGPHVRMATGLRETACDAPTVALGVYPDQSLLYYLTGLRPVAGYPFLYPWVAEIALPAVIEDLGRRDAVVVVDVAGAVWGRENRAYLAPLLRYLEGNYRRLGTDVWISPALAARCHGMIGRERP